MLRNRAGRRGAVAPLSCFLFMVMVALLAFGVDVGYMVVVQNELQNAADAASLAGASQLLLPTTTTLNMDALSKSATANAKTEAQKFSLQNAAGNVNLKLNASDVVVGTSLNAGPVTAWVPSSAFPNAVQVTIYRDANTNGRLPLFFGPAIGTPTWAGSATATAVFKMGQGTVTGFNPGSSGRNPLLLPIGIDINYWNTFIKTGVSPDGLVHDDYTVALPTSTVKPPNNVSSGPDSIPELTNVYPDSTSPGNFGLLSLGAPVTDDPSYSNWIKNGPSPTDMAYFGRQGLQATPSAPATLAGGPGWKSNLQTDLLSIVGQQRIVPLFSSYNGQGANTTYSVVGFAGVTVCAASGRGSNELITFQPCVVVDPTGTSSSGSTGGGNFVYNVSPLRLVR